MRTDHDVLEWGRGQRARARSRLGRFRQRATRARRAPAWLSLFLLPTRRAFLLLASRFLCALYTRLGAAPLSPPAMGSQDGHDDSTSTAPPLQRSASHASTHQSDDQFDEAPTGNSPALAQEQLPTEEQATAHLTPASAPTTNDDNATLAALAASSSSSLPISPTAISGEDLDIDPNSPSFILVAALRSQITDLTSQVTSLNSKLVRSYTSIGDLEDEVHERREGERRAKAKAVELEQDKQRWEREIERGGWVERVSALGARSLQRGKS